MEHGEKSPHMSALVHALFVTGNKCSQCLKRKTKYVCAYCSFLFNLLKNFLWYIKSQGSMMFAHIVEWSAQANWQILHLIVLEGDSPWPHSWQFQVYTVTGLSSAAQWHSELPFHLTGVLSLTSISASLPYPGGRHPLSFYEPLH